MVVEPALCCRYKQSEASSSFLRPASVTSAASAKTWAINGMQSLEFQVEGQFQRVLRGVVFIVLAFKAELEDSIHVAWCRMRLKVATTL